MRKSKHGTRLILRGKISFLWIFSLLRVSVVCLELVNADDPTRFAHENNEHGLNDDDKQEEKAQQQPPPQDRACHWGEHCETPRSRLHSPPPSAYQPQQQQTNKKAPTWNESHLGSTPDLNVEEIIRDNDTPEGILNDEDEEIDAGTATLRLNQHFKNAHEVPPPVYQHHLHQFGGDSTGDVPHHLKTPTGVGYPVSARVFLDEATGLARFDDEDGILLPYQECGRTGISTEPLKIQQALFRSSIPVLSTTGPTAATSDIPIKEETAQEDSEDQDQESLQQQDEQGEESKEEEEEGEQGKERGWFWWKRKRRRREQQQVHHPHQQQLWIALVDMEMTLLPQQRPQEKHTINRKTFTAGSVILLEPNVISSITGHVQCRALRNQELHMLVLTLLPKHVLCRLDDEDDGSSGMTSSKTDQSSRHRKRERGDSNHHHLMVSQQQRQRLRQWVLGGMGMGLSLLLADWMGKVAPMWLAVGIGGTCLVAGCTAGFVQVGEWVLDHHQPPGSVVADLFFQQDNVENDAIEEDEEDSLSSPVPPKLDDVSIIQESPQDAS